ncbi:hypothetical protein SAMN05444172_3904 [Burkholderia sp. GAS332]|jgi:hypothetical protein|nr:hypothetical protein SAMN05444172_3904 [Burkholderia sp. GAS332]
MSLWRAPGIVQTDGSGHSALQLPDLSRIKNTRICRDTTAEWRFHALCGTFSRQGPVLRSNKQPSRQ